jgi:hypothetical protein
MPSPETSRRNLEKANAVRRPPLPWRSLEETRLIKALAWQWFKLNEPRCGLRQIARHLGVSHAYVQKLVREFRADPRNVLQQQRAYGRGTFAEFQRARGETVRMREHGSLRLVFLRKPLPGHEGYSRPVAGLVHDPLAEVKHSALLAAEEKSKLRPMPFFKRSRRLRP